MLQGISWAWFQPNSKEQKATSPSSCCSVAKSCRILCDPMDCSTAACLSLSPVRFMSIESVLLSNHLISTPFSFGFQSSPTSGSFPMSWLFESGDLSIGASTSASVLPKNIQLISFRVDWFDLHAVQGTLKSLPQHHNLKASVLQRSASLTVHLSHPYVITSKTIALTIGTFVCFSIRCLGWSQLFFQGVSLNFMAASHRWQ